MSEMISFTKITLENIYQSISGEIIDKSMEKYALNHFNDTKLLSKIVCHDNGYYSKKRMKCLCEFCFFGKYCRYSGYYFWGKDYRNLRILYGILYGILGFMIWYYFIKKIIKESDCYKRLLRILFTPKYIIMIILLIISNSKIIFNFIV
jgi:hypothetical protein